MDKLTAIKIKYDDGTYSDEIPVSVLAENVEWDSTHTLVDVLGNIDTDVTGSIQDQISQLFNEKVSASSLQNYVASQLSADVTTWLNKYVSPVGSAIMVDKSLSIEGSAADANATGNMIKNFADNIIARNAFNIIDILSDYYYNTNGVLSADERYYYTDNYVLIRPNTTYYAYGKRSSF